jgi:hypothetical protein
MASSVARRVRSAVAVCSVLCLMLFAASAGAQTAARSTPTVEGEWTVRQPTEATTATGYTIRRQGGGYLVIPTGAGAGEGVAVGLYRGGPTEITTEHLFTAEELASEPGRTPVQVLRDLGGKVSLRFRFRVSNDGRSMEFAHDVYTVYWYANTLRMAKFEVNPWARTAMLDRVPDRVVERPAPTAPAEPRALSGVVDPNVVKGGSDLKRPEPMTADAVVGGLKAEAVRLGWDDDKRARLDNALKHLDLDSSPTASVTDVARVRQAINARGQDSEIAREAARGEGPALLAAGTQGGSSDCTIFALANAAGLPYGVVAARAGELMRQASWRSADERANPQKAIEGAGLNGGEVIMLAEVFGRANAVKQTDFAATLRAGRPIMVNMAGHEAVLTKTFLHDGQQWYEVMNSYTAPQERQYVNAAELATLLVENGVSFTPDRGTVPASIP